jgi:mannose-1-phosphate guanylyltransferase
MAHIQKRDPNATVVLLTADHHIMEKQRFREVLAAGCTLAQAGGVVTLGISPSMPSTAFGYIERGDQYESIDGFTAYQAVKFTEKPALERAIEFLSSGRFSWNSGMFIWRADTAMREFERQQPDMYRLMKTVQHTIGSHQYHDTLIQIWDEIPKISLDYAVMEKALQMSVIPIDIGWSDVGSWDALYGILPANAEGNIFRGDAAQHVSIDSHNTLIYADRLIVTIGVSDLVVVDTGDALMICHKDRAQDVKKVVTLLQDGEQTQYL